MSSSSSMSSETTPSSDTSVTSTQSVQQEFTQFMATTPVVIPPVPEIVYDRYWLRLLTVSAPDPLEPSTVYCEFRPCKAIAVPPGKEVKKPEAEGDIKTVKMENVFEFISDPDEPAEVRLLVMQAMEMLFRALDAYARLKGAL